MKHICLFTHSGATYTFRNINIITDNETMLVFNYEAMSDGIFKRMTVLKESLVGYSTWEAV